MFFPKFVNFHCSKNNFHCSKNNPLYTVLAFYDLFVPFHKMYLLGVYPCLRWKTEIIISKKKLFQNFSKEMNYRIFMCANETENKVKIYDLECNTDQKCFNP